MIEAACFDLDGTLLVGRSAERRLTSWLARRHELRAQSLARSLARAATLPWRGTGHALRSNKLHLAGVSAPALHVLAARFVESILVPALNPRVLEEVARARAAGARLFLLTGAPDVIAGAVSRHLSFDGHLGTRLEVREGRFTGELAGPHWFGPTKVRGVAQLAARWGFDPAHAWAFADHEADVPFLSVFGRPVAVNPHPGLRRAAVQKGWEIIAGG